ncbi:MAG: nucleotidyl transferase AbiEii/AbiGii toxin family protein [Verrucomicrobia bacterium]|nr:nucleotidyl transferase AbiEii/AbiGii toxin family protein [Verrucomicrobiota bacterium]
MTAPKNLPASVKARLLALAEKRGESFNLLVVRFGIERLLYRLSQSRHADRFLLKGAMLFALWDEKAPRPTQDVDLLAFGPTELKDMEATFREIVETPVPADGLVFKADSIRAENIREADAYGGVRVRLLAMLGKGELPLQVDLGTGDVVTPAADKSVFPALLDFPAPHIRSYPIYTVVAEKFEAMVKLGITNSRMKDFYDVWFLSRRFDFGGATLHKAIHATFARRQTALGPQMPYPLTDGFANEAAKQTQWAAFLRRNGLTGSPPKFADVIVVLREFVGPALQPNIGVQKWHRGEGWLK